MRYIFVVILSATILQVGAQTAEIDYIVQEVLGNNMELKAFRESVNAELADSKASVALPNPEIEFGYLWGSPSAIGNRQDLSVSQEFDLATLIGTKRKLYTVQERMSSHQIEILDRNIMLRTRECCIELLYANSMLEELRQRESNAALMLQAQQKMVESGQGNRIDLNNASLMLLSIQGEIKRAQSNQSQILMELQRLNGGNAVSLSGHDIPIPTFTQDFEQWFAQNQQSLPELNLAQVNVENKHQELSLSKVSNLPSITAGYMSERVTSESFQGITVGLSIPLWSARKRVTGARGDYMNSVITEQQAIQDVYTSLKSLHEQAIGLQESLALYEEALTSATNSTLLLQALDAGQISIVDYIASESLYYDLMEELLICRRDLAKALTTLLYTTR